MTNTNLPFGGAPAPASGGGQELPPEAYNVASAQALSNFAAQFFAGGEKGHGPLAYEEWRIGRTGLMGWRWTVYDWAEGLGMTQGILDEGHDRLASHDVDIRGPGQATLSLLRTAQPETGLTLGSTAFSHCNVFGRMVVGIQAGNGYSLWKENSATDPTLVRLSGFNPAASTSAILVYSIVIASGTVGTPRLLVTHYGSATKAGVYSDIGTTPTLDGSLTGLPQNIVGVIQTTIQTTPGGALILFLTDDGIYRLKASDILTATGVKTTATASVGGYAYGLVFWGGLLRAFWGLVRHDSIQPWDYGQERKVRLLSTNQIGEQPEEITTPYGETGFYHLAPWQDGFACSDGASVWFVRYPRNYYNLDIFQDRIADSTVTRMVRGFYVIGPRLIARVDEWNTAGSASMVTYDLEYHEGRGRWRQITKARAIAAAGAQSHFGNGPTLPYSETTRFRHGLTFADESFDRQYSLQYGETPYGLRSSSGSTGRSYEASDSFRTPTLRWRGGTQSWGKKITKMGLVPPASLSGGRAVATGSAFTGTVGGENANEQITYGQSWSADNWPYNKPPYQVWRENRTLFRALSLSGTVYQGSDAQLTPQILPFFIEGVMGADDARVREYVYHG